MNSKDFLKKRLESRKKKMPCSMCDLVFDDLGKLLSHEENHDGISSNQENTDFPASAPPKRKLPYRD